MSVFSHGIYFNTYECWVCSVPFAITAALDERLRNSGERLYCPRGCQLAFGEGSLAKAQREKKEIELSMQAQLNKANHARLVAEKSERKAKLDKAKVERRIAHGVCPCCKKTFADLSHHMIENHKEFRLPGGKKQKQIAGAA